MDAFCAFSVDSLRDAEYSRLGPEPHESTMICQALVLQCVCVCCVFPNRIPRHQPALVGGVATW